MSEQPVGIDELLGRVRETYARVEPHETYEAAQAGEALLVDIRYAALRERDGLIPARSWSSATNWSGAWIPGAAIVRLRRPATICGSW
ncbi:hypothetical protein GCM10023084_29850 [Streptomyces lacrimifluminis]|uniref:Uncharacterized protein n=1 Tax=Streptomyces lacrimifluminis TaxID=1500077 RepID=A0A917NTK2_9ACTN|nr:hypothetical protein GCM10012282_26470 [Streptomyces lacrimifluminis]